MPALWLPKPEPVTHPEEDVKEDGEEEPLMIPKQNTTGPTQVMPTAPILTAPTPARLRDMLEDMVLRDLLGPAGGEEEEIEEARVRDRYLIGMLAPNDLQTAPEEQDELAIAEEGSEDSGPADLDATQTRSLNPSSMGMSFCVNKDAPGLLVTVRWGQYKREQSETLTDAQGAPRRVWRRKPRGETTTFFPLKEGSIEIWRPEPEEQPDVFVKGIMRRSSENWTVTLFLVNGQQTPNRLQDEAWLFQPEMVIEAPDCLPIFGQRPSSRRHASAWPCSIAARSASPLAMVSVSMPRHFPTIPPVLSGSQLALLHALMSPSHRLPPPPRSLRSRIWSWI
jgi:hypothetical protein